ncbi:MAG: dephospho-CoA kinase [Lachnospiraceae bacterium]|nr:dephospho-CoA kinase [Lachnospiraceae bacterium]MBR1670401.1 dephospho-CoA kinase [Butyrivibrio sp.]
MKENCLRHGKCNIIGITGGVGAGKSTLLEYIKGSYNALVIYSDNVANDIKKKGLPAYDSIVALLGKEILGCDYEIDKKKMAQAIFGNEELLDEVNKILHPAVNDYIINIIESERARFKYDFVFVEAALLIENGYRDIVDEMWYVYADEEIRRDRLKRSRGYSDDRIREIFLSQLSDDEFRKSCDFVIDNSGEEGAAFEQIDNKLGEWKNNGEFGTA